MIRILPRYVGDSAPGTLDRNVERAIRFAPAGGRVLDLGAGRGALSSRLRQAGFQVTAVDLRPMSGPAFEGCTTVQANLDQGIPLGDGGFDAAVCQEVMHQLENPWFVFREVGRVLGPRGSFVLSTPNVCHLFVRLHELAFHTTPHFLEPQYREARQMNPLPLWTLRRMAAQAGFETGEVTYNMNYVPGLRLQLPGRGARLGHTLIVVFHKAGSDHA